MPVKPWIESPEVSADPRDVPYMGFDAAQPGSDRTAYTTFYGGGRSSGKRAEAWRRMREWVDGATVIRAEAGEVRPMKDITAIATVRRV